MKTGSMIVMAMVAGAVGGSAVGGPLEPPAGPIGPTMKTLDEVEARSALTVEAFPGDADSVVRID